MAQLNNANINGSLNVTSSIAENGDLVDHKYANNISYEWIETAHNSETFQYYFCLLDAEGNVISRAALTGLTRSLAHLTALHIDYTRV